MKYRIFPSIPINVVKNEPFLLSVSLDLHVGYHASGFFEVYSNEAHSVPGTSMICIVAHLFAASMLIPR